ncbi:DNA polymerase Y family protein [Phragmitibacter flavus]|uniref:DNA polymerase Y family protein n=1 Tax=Phragmitibacter flavus TaxID=2576071 RepID=A0A5R8KAT3_9BACT|nr:DNA polymerase Y family protein [Phragmitibacter flavus]TLD69423.1 DNA polymerase Y family protein [Phragmitibacter flavus]
MKGGLSAFYAALWLPRFHLQAVLCRQAFSKRWVAVLDGDGDGSNGEDEDMENKGRVLHANGRAEAQGVVAGMTASQALARCPRLELLRRDAQGERAAQEVLLACASLWTPDYESTQPGLCVLDLSRSSFAEVKRDSREAGQRMREWLREKRLGVRVGMACKADLAILAAFAARPVLTLGDDAEDGAKLLQHLPLSVLKPSREVMEVLRLWGIRTLAQLAALPRAEMALRLGQEGLWLWDLCRGGRGRLLKRVCPVVGYREEVELEHPVECLEPLLFLLRRLLDDLCGRLADAWLVASAQWVQLRFDDRTVYENTLRVAEPTRNAALLLRLLHTHLEGVSAGAPIVAVALELVSVRPFGQQSGLFERGLRDPNRLAETLGQLEALLGAGQVGRVKMLPSRRPDAFTLVNYLEPVAAAEASLPGSEERLLMSNGLPLRRYRPVRPVLVGLDEGGRPEALQVGGGGWLKVTAAGGPWLVSGDWWNSGAWEREVWEVAVDDGALYQLVREKQGWVLDGLFG